MAHVQVVTPAYSFKLSHSNRVAFIMSWKGCNSVTDEQVKLLEQFGTDPIIVGITQALFKQYQKGLKEYGKPLSACGDYDLDWKSEIISELVDVVKYQQMEIRRLERLLNP